MYSDEDNVQMMDDTQFEYTGEITGIINDKVFRKTGECVVVKTRKEGEHDRT